MRARTHTTTATTTTTTTTTTKSSRIRRQFMILVRLQPNQTRTRMLCRLTCSNIARSCPSSSMVTGNSTAESFASPPARHVTLTVSEWSRAQQALLHEGKLNTTHTPRCRSEPTYVRRVPVLCWHQQNHTTKRNTAKTRRTKHQSKRWGRATIVVGSVAGLIICEPAQRTNASDDQLFEEATVQATHQHKD